MSIARATRSATRGGMSMTRSAWRARTTAIMALVAAVALPMTVHAVVPEVWPSFTQAQADEGKQLYADRCANCHGANLEGVGTPALTGTSFVRRWGEGNKTVGDLYAKMRDTMPMMAPHSLSDDQYARIASFILSHAGYRAGTAPLGPDTMKVVLNPPPGAAGAAGGP